MNCFRHVYVWLHIINGITMYDVTVKIKPLYVAKGYCGGWDICDFILYLELDGHTENKWVEKDNDGGDDDFKDAKYFEMNYKFGDLDKLRFKLIDDDSGGGITNDDDSMGYVKLMQSDMQEIADERGSIKYHFSGGQYIKELFVCVTFKANCVVQRKAHASYDETTKGDEISIPLKSAVTYQCKDGFHYQCLRETKELSCMLTKTHLHDSGNHSTFTCKPRQCPKPEAVGIVSVSKHTSPDGYTINVECLPGKSVESSLNKVNQTSKCECENGEMLWIPYIQNCSEDVTCSEMSHLANGFILHSNSTPYSNTRMKHGTSLTIKCEEGFLPAHSTITCQLNGSSALPSWSHSAVCMELPQTSPRSTSDATEHTGVALLPVMLQCDPVSPPTNGMFFHTDGSPYLSTWVNISTSLLLACRSGYNSNGNETNPTCLSSLTGLPKWSMAIHDNCRKDDRFQLQYPEGPYGKPMNRTTRPNKKNSKRAERPFSTTADKVYSAALGIIVVLLIIVTVKNATLLMEIN